MLYYHLDNLLFPLPYYFQLFFTCVHICVFMPVCAHICMIFTCTHACTCRWRPGNSLKYCVSRAVCIIWDSLSLARDSWIQLYWLPSEPRILLSLSPQSCRLHLYRAMITDIYHHSWPFLPRL